ncbi:hypothetical protein BU17DRAFT_66864 [Hysterangium stoloniferum]|nr:hypothetical protein BU17DRAFT_66864 [Hysterangium stoloniferum]
MTYPSQQHILDPSNEMVPLIGLSDHNAKQIANRGVLNIHPNAVDIVPNRDRNTLTPNSTGPILDTFKSLPFVRSVAHWTSSHQSTGPHPGMFNDLLQGLMNNYSTTHEDNLSIPLPGPIANEDSSGNHSMSPILVPAVSTGGLSELQDYSTVELPSPSYSLPHTQYSATVGAASKAAIPVSTPSPGSPGNGGPPMESHTIVPIPDSCSSKEYHELLSPKSRPSKVEKGFMCIECSRVPFTTRKNGMRHARNAKKIHQCPICHEYFARIDYRNSHKKFCSGKKGQGFSRGL